MTIAIFVNKIIIPYNKTVKWYIATWEKKQQQTNSIRRIALVDYIYFKAMSS